MICEHSVVQELKLTTDYRIEQIIGNKKAPTDQLVQWGQNRNSEGRTPRHSRGISGVWNPTEGQPRSISNLP